MVTAARTRPSQFIHNLRSVGSVTPGHYCVCASTRCARSSEAASAGTVSASSSSPASALLHRVVALESALPLLLVAIVSIVVGLMPAALYLHPQVGIAFSIPGIAYWATVADGLEASLAIDVGR
jgi:hypothetical protein